MHLEDAPIKDEDSTYILLGTSEPEQEINPNELIIVQEIECPEHLQKDLYKMLTCRVLMPKLNVTGDINLKCSICSQLFTDLVQLTNHKKMYKICNNNLSMPILRPNIVDERFDGKDFSKRHEYFKSQLNSFYF